MSKWSAKRNEHLLYQVLSDATEGTKTSLRGWQCHLEEETNSKELEADILRLNEQSTNEKLIRRQQKF